MNSDEILHYLHRNVYGKQHTTGVFACDRIKKPSDKKACAYILNTDPHYKKGYHWVAVYIDQLKKNGYYFDSYGLPPVRNEFVDFFRENCTNYTYNDVRVQDIKSNACGEFCLYFLIHMSYGWSPDDIIYALKKRPDSEVLEYVEHLLL